MLDAKDIFGEEPETDEIQEAPTPRDNLPEDDAFANVLAEASAQHGIEAVVDEDDEMILDVERRIQQEIHKPKKNPATEKQVDYIHSLLDQKQLPDYFEDEGHLRERLAANAVDKAEASQIIGALRGFRRKPDKNIRPALMPTIEQLPAGRYAIDNDDGTETRFYSVWRAEKYGKPEFVKVYLQHGPDESEVPYRAAVTICRRIVAAGPLEAAQRYGREIKRCCRCHIRLTNRLSRELGIGPVCGGRMFGDEFEEKKQAARASLEAQGLDPDEEIED